VEILKLPNRCLCDNVCVLHGAYSFFMFVKISRLTWHSISFASLMELASGFYVTRDSKGIAYKRLRSMAGEIM
jgi:hypothetical protein